MDDDEDGSPQVAEYLRGQDPFVSDLGSTVDFRAIDFPDGKYAVLTFASLLSTDYEVTREGYEVSSEPVSLFGDAPIEDAVFTDHIVVSRNLSDWGTEPLNLQITLVENPLIPADMPALEGGWIYRQVRFIKPMAELPDTAFMRFEMRQLTAPEGP